MANRVSRLNSRELKLIKKYLFRRDGYICNKCHKDFPANKLIVDHIDNNYLNNEPNNLQLLCQKCNIEKNPPYNKKTDVDYQGEREGNNVVEGSESYLGSTPELRIESYSIWKNFRSEPIFREWLRSQMRKKLRMEVKQVVYDGANVANCSPKTTQVYLDKLVFETGPYKIVKEKSTGIRFLEWKESCFPFKNEIDKWAK